MSKGSMLMGTSSGKLGEMVLYRAKGEQRARTRLRKIANPRTEGQMVNRVNLSNLILVYRVSRLLLDRAFPLKKQNQSDYNRFVQINKSMYPVYLTKEQAKDQGNAVLAPYAISEGNLLPLSYATGVTGIKLIPAVRGGTSTQDIINAYFNTFNDAMETDSIVAVFWDRSTGLVMRSVDIDMNIAESVASYMTMDAQGNVTIIGETGTTVGYAFIRTRKENNVLRVSSQNVSLTENGAREYTEKSNVVSRQQAIDSYGVQPTSILPKAANNSLNVADLIVHGWIRNPQLADPFVSTMSNQTTEQKAGYLALSRVPLEGEIKVRFEDTTTGESTVIVPIRVQNRDYNYGVLCEFRTTADQLTTAATYNLVAEYNGTPINAERPCTFRVVAPAVQSNEPAASKASKRLI